MVESIGSIIAILSFIYAIYENRKNRKLINYNREQAWEIYRQSSNVLAFYQILQDFKLDGKEVIRNIAAGERAALELVLSSIRMIKQFEKKFDAAKIEEWHKEGRLVNETHIKAFKNYV
ncbi:MAG: hypothetical protein PHP46_03005 [Candidatus Omnitrophica bacterium]|nr:hypothetical protein [Candidatus Omnitrophota bacterium]